MFGYAYQRNVQVSTFSNMKTEYTSCNFFQQREIWGCRSAKIGSHFHRLSGISDEIARNGEMQRLYFSFGLSVVSYEIV